jgi:predicted lipoprotein with Yx(FWY)xxD motif
MKRAISLLVIALIAFPLTAAQAQNPPAPSAVKIATAAGSSMFTNVNGMTLYVYDPDTAGKSACNGPCATNWPPLAAAADAAPVGKFSIVTRDDGSTQWAYDGKALYAWKNDSKPGDTTGDGIGGKWHIAKP